MCTNNLHFYSFYSPPCRHLICTIHFFKHDDSCILFLFYKESTLTDVFVTTSVTGVCKLKQCTKQGPHRQLTAARQTEDFPLVRFQNSQLHLILLRIGRISHLIKVEPSDELSSCQSCICCVQNAHDNSCEVGSGGHPKQSLRCRLLIHNLGN